MVGGIKNAYQLSSRNVQDDAMMMLPAACRFFLFLRNDHIFPRGILVSLAFNLNTLGQGGYNPCTTRTLACTLNHSRQKWFSDWVLKAACYRANGSGTTAYLFDNTQAPQFLKNTHIVRQIMIYSVSIHLQRRIHIAGSQPN